MLKKAGIIAAVAASGLLVLSPQAFADGSDEGGHGGHHHGGLLNVSDLGVQAPVQLCNTSIAEGAVGVLASHQRNSDEHDGKCRQDNSQRDH